MLKDNLPAIYHMDGPQVLKMRELWVPTKKKVYLLLKYGNLNFITNNQNILFMT